MRYRAKEKFSKKGFILFAVHRGIVLFEVFIDLKIFNRLSGKFFAEEMAYLDSSIQQTLNRCRAIGRADTRDIRIQEVWQNNAMSDLYALAGAYQSEHPNHTVRYVRFTNRLPIDDLLDNEFDVVFEVWCGPYSERCKELYELGVRAVPFLTEPLLIWYQEGNRHFEGIQKVDLETLLDIPIIMSRGLILDYMVVSYASYCEREGFLPRLRHMQYTDNSPTGVFMSDFRDSVLMTSPAMVNDPRLKSRSDLSYAIVEDERIQATFLLAVRSDDKEACDFLDYAWTHHGENGVIPIQNDMMRTHK